MIIIILKTIFISFVFLSFRESDWIYNQCSFMLETKIAKEIYIKIFFFFIELEITIWISLEKYKFFDEKIFIEGIISFSGKIFTVILRIRSDLDIDYKLIASLKLHHITSAVEISFQFIYYYPQITYTCTKLCIKFHFSWILFTLISNKLIENSNIWIPLNYNNKYNNNFTIQFV